MKIYTKTGDKGMTGLYTGQRVAKDSLRVETYGTVDEVDTALGMARALCTNDAVKITIYDVQKVLWQTMAEIASEGADKVYITAENIAAIERLIDSYDATLPPLTAFVVPGDNPGSAALHVARTTARRAERQAIRLARQETVNENVLILLNRLSDLCFILSRAEDNAHTL
jgi:cob(I)alamin adenosyltransferase